ncbi:MAG: hypothetical protein ABWX63_07085 [Paeniglutamicibacter terrestris]
MLFEPFEGFRARFCLPEWSNPLCWIRRLLITHGTSIRIIEPVNYFVDFVQRAWSYRDARDRESIVGRITSAEFVLRGFLKKAVAWIPREEITTPPPILVAVSG